MNLAIFQLNFQYICNQRLFSVFNADFWNFAERLHTYWGNICFWHYETILKTCFKILNLLTFLSMSHLTHWTRWRPPQVAIFILGWIFTFYCNNRKAYLAESQKLKCGKVLESGIMKWKFEQWWSSVPAILTKHTTTSHIKALNTEEKKQVLAGDMFKPVKGTPTPPSFNWIFNHNSYTIV